VRAAGPPAVQLLLIRATRYNLAETGGPACGTQLKTAAILLTSQRLARARAGRWPASSTTAAQKATRYNLAAAVLLLLKRLPLIKF
jgi:hypothetical protein